MNDANAAKWFYEGLPPGQSIPWNAWLVPLSRWIPFLLSMLLASYALVALFRKPWREHERLSYPLMQLPEPVRFELAARRVVLRRRPPYRGTRLDASEL